MDLASPRLFRWADIPEEAVTSMLDRRIVTGERVMASRIRLRKGCIVPRHAHEAEQLSWVFDGALRFAFGNRSITVRAGQVLVIPPWLPHAAEALGDTDELDVFSPIRHDWLDGSDTYFHAAAATPAHHPETDGVATLHRWRDTAVERQTTHIARAYLTAERTTLAQVRLKAGAVVPRHEHESEQLTWVHRGALELSLDGQRFTVRPGAVLRVPSGVPHDARALEDTVVLDIFSPRRDDWLAKTDDYFRLGNPPR